MNKLRLAPVRQSAVRAVRFSLTATCALLYLFALPVFSAITTTTVGEPNTTIVGQRATVAATVNVAPADVVAGVPTGSVQFFENGAAFGSPLSLVPLTPASCGANSCAVARASIFASGLAVGTHTLTA